MSQPSNSVRKEIFAWIRSIGGAVILALLLTNFVIINAHVLSESMETTIMTGDRVLGSRLAYLGKDPQRYDIVIFRFEEQAKPINYVKRVIGLPGETVRIVDGKVYINDSDTPLPDYFTNETPTGDFGPYEVPEDCYFFLGDNREHSTDSRFWQNPFIHRKQILGKLWVSYYPNVRTWDPIEE